MARPPVLLGGGIRGGRRVRKWRRGVHGIVFDAFVEGDIDGAPRFEVLSSGPLEARLRMAYTYAWDEKSKEPQTTCVLLSRATPDAPWQLADLSRACDERASFAGMLRKAFPNGKYP